MDIKDYAKLAARCYSDKPTYGEPDSAGRAVVYGDVVAFPGTDNIACWLADLNVDTVGVPGIGEVHEGFWMALWSIHEPLMQHKGVNVTVGHSEGAALAILYAARLCVEGRPPVAVYAFEPPRVSADTRLRELFQEHGVKVILTQHGEDVVPMIPRLFRDWQHPADLMKFGKPAYPFPNVEDHMMDNVIAALPSQSNT